MLAVALTVLAGCSINPSTGRGQFLALPAVQAIQADINVVLTGGATRGESAADCAGRAGIDPSTAAPNPDCVDPEQLARFKRQVERIGSELSAEARGFAPELFERINGFQVSIQSDSEGGTGSNSRGRILLSAALSRLDATDDVVAFLIAREMGHVIARHDEEDAGARMAFSVLTALVPGASMIVRLAASTLGSMSLTRTWADQQRREADDLALALLERTDRSRAVIALNLRAGLRRERLGDGQWSLQLSESIERANVLVRVRPAMPLLAAAGN